MLPTVKRDTKTINKEDLCVVKDGANPTQMQTESVKNVECQRQTARRNMGVYGVQQTVKSAEVNHAMEAVNNGW